MDNQFYTLNEVIKIHQDGRFKEAIALYERILETNGDSDYVLYLLGTAYLQFGDTSKGIPKLKESLALNSNNASAYNNLGSVLAETGLLEEAEKSFRKSLALIPDQVEAINNLGNLLGEMNRKDEAEVMFRRAIELRPDFVDALLNLGQLLVEQEKYEDVLYLYEKVSRLRPDNPDAFNNIGVIHQRLKQYDKAASCYEKAISLNSSFTEAYNNLGIAYFSMKRYDEAAKSYEKAIEFNPSFSQAYQNLAFVLRANNHINEAETTYRKALTFPDTDHSSIYISLGMLYQQQGRMNEAQESFQKVMDCGDKMGATSELAIWNKSLLQLMSGNYLEGWELYEVRIKKHDAKNALDHYPEKINWRGEESLVGKKILVQSEQGLGDIVQFCRYLPELDAIGAEVLFATHKSLLPLVKSLKCPVTYFVSGDRIPDFDAYCPLMSLPYAFKTQLGTIPSKSPYLFADKNKVSRWRRKIGKDKSPKIGLVWSGSTDHANDSKRSVRLETMLPLFDLPFEWHSLQKEYRDYDKEVLSSHPEIIQHQDKLNDFSDTAALIGVLDLVICVDTSVAHVAGALGKRVWIMLPFVSDFRWLMGRVDSPWYPSARLFRQNNGTSGWDGVIQNIRSELLDSFEEVLVGENASGS